VATVFQKKSIIFSTVSMYRSECLVVSGEKVAKGRILKLLTQALVGYGTVLTGER
jgi:hypothetical protein